MLNWISDYYVGEKVEDPASIQKQINDRKGPFSVHVITLPVNPSNTLEITAAITLRQKYMYDRCPTIIGLAADKESAMELASRILEECYRETGSFKVEEYLKNR